MNDSVVIDAWASNLDQHFRRMGWSRRPIAQGDRNRSRNPLRRPRAERGDPDNAVDLPRSDQAFGVKSPGVVGRRAGAEAGSHRETGHPPANSQSARTVVGRRQGQRREASELVEISDEAVEHFDLKRVEAGGRPDGDAEFRLSQQLRDGVETRQRRVRRRRPRTPFDPRTQRRKIGREVSAFPEDDGFDATGLSAGAPTAPSSRGRQFVALARRRCRAAQAQTAASHSKPATPHQDPRRPTTERHLVRGLHPAS